MFNIEDWISIPHLSESDFMKYLNTLSEDDHAKELQQYGKQLAIELLRDDMTKYTSFYKFMKSYSPKDYKYTNRKEYVSQRVIAKHVELWNETHTKKLRTLRIFFL